MDETRKLIARRMFRLRVHEAKGTEFQHLFEQVMQYRYPGFKAIKPHGNVGDRKNDGYIASLGRYFQVYAPEEPHTNDSAVAAARKAAKDFAGLVAYWQKIAAVKEYRFVFNDEYRGTPPPLEEALAAIQKDHGISASVMLTKELEDEAMKLDPDQLADVINSSIPETSLFDSVDFGVLREVVQHVLRQADPVTIDDFLEAPDFDQKIQFNGLSKGVAVLLTYGSYQSDAVDDYFSKNSTFARQQVRDHLSSTYSLCRTRISNAASPLADAGDLVFFRILDTIVPRVPAASREQSARVQQAAIVVMAYYFEACDIFESPDVAT
jgi:hypothetical protein